MPAKPPTEKEFVSTIRAYLARKKISQGELAKELGRNRVTVARWLNGRQTPGDLTRAGIVSILNK